MSPGTRGAGAPPAGPILLVEGDGELAEALTGELTADGYRVELARTAEHARVLATHGSPQLALLGGLPPPRGALALLEEIRTCGPRETPWDRDLPAIVLGARGDELELTRAFDAGADDFLPGPPRYLELRARVRAVLRRCQAREPSRAIEIGALRIDTSARTVALAGRPVELRRREFELLCQLAYRPEHAFSRSELLQGVWGYAAGSTRTVDSHASRVRLKLEAAGGGRWVVSVWGVGYRLR